MRERGWVEPAELSPSGRTKTVAIRAAGGETFTNARRAWREAQDAVIGALGAGAPPRSMTG
ncbi:MAG TPA: hypothetical protein VK501_04395 [Baekduia sp.]|uniref:hypothetical protein n=1 Tax=Baekduia sp. TaxID=2600305 RepID=UPI002B5DF742|nr:hypothetical protein [Baekduia sp.]HMJ33138.1 hypothetical protein [Baekduia sp.]